jgi:hypothetical protein
LKSHETVEQSLNWLIARSLPYFIYSRIFQQQTEYHNKHNNTKIKHNNDCSTGLMINTPNGGLYSNLRFSLEFYYIATNS